jgi:hypothetical protein
MEFELCGEEGGGEFGVCSCTSSCTPDLRGDIMELLAVLLKLLALISSLIQGVNELCLLLWDHL